MDHNFKAGDVLQNKFNSNLIVRLLDSSGTCISPYEYKSSISLSVWEHTSYLRWFMVFSRYFIIRLYERINYNLNKELGLVDNCLPSGKYPNYCWRENYYQSNFEISIWNWFILQMKYLF